MRGWFLALLFQAAADFLFCQQWVKLLCANSNIMAAVLWPLANCFSYLCSPGRIRKVHSPQLPFWIGSHHTGHSSIETRSWEQPGRTLLCADPFHSKIPRSWGALWLLLCGWDQVPVTFIPVWPQSHDAFPSLLGMLLFLCLKTWLRTPPTFLNSKRCSWPLSVFFLKTIDSAQLPGTVVLRELEGSVWNGTYAWDSGNQGNVSPVQTSL